MGIPSVVYGFVLVEQLEEVKGVGACLRRWQG